MSTRTDPSDDSIGALLAEVGWVQALALRLARDQAEAEDVAQGALLLALERAPDRRSGLRPWLAGVVARLARHAVRGEVRRGAREARVAAERAAAARRADEAGEQLELQQALTRCVAELPEPYRSVIVQRYYGNRSVAEIAKAAGTTSGTVRSQLGRGLDRLRARYARESGERDPLGAFLLVAGLGGSEARASLELVLLNTATKKTAIAVAVLIAAAALYVGLLPTEGGRPVGGAPIAGAPWVEREPDLASNAPIADAEPWRAPAPAASESDEVVETAGVAAPVPSYVTTLRARVLDDRRRPLAGATLSSVQPDGRPASGGASSTSDADGRVVLRLGDDALRRWRDEVFDMTFAVGADGYATEFRVTRPRLHGDSDLGDIALEAGGALAGVCLDVDGRPVSGAVVVAVSSGAPEDHELAGRAGPGDGAARPWAETDAQGRFVLRGVARAPTGPGVGARAGVRAWAHAPGFLWTIGEPVAVRAGARTDVGALVLLPVPSELRIDGVVRLPSGAPRGGALVDFLSLGAPHHGRVPTDAQGRFTLAVRDGAPIELVARDPRGTQGMSSTVVATGGDRVELLLRSPRTLVVRVVDPEGSPLIDTDVMAVLPDDSAAEDGEHRLLPGARWLATDAAGEVTLDVPAQVFAVSARRAGSGERIVGPLHPDSAPGSLQITLPRGPEVSGRVLADGAPVAGARVAVMQRYEGFAAMTGGFANRYPSGAPTVRTDEEGRFAAPVKLGWRRVGVLAIADGFADAEVELELQPGAGARGVEVAMTSGGAIEGRVLPPPGMEVDALYVAASRGDGRPRSVRVDAEGAYRFEGLTPGPWRVEGRFEEARTEMLSTSTLPRDREERWNVFVTDGAVARFDLDMRGAGPVEVLGRLRVDGAAPPSGWTVQAVTPLDSRGAGELPAVSLDGEGRFALRAPAGRVVLRLVGPLPGGATLELNREVDLEPGSTWEESLRTGWLRDVLEADVQRARWVRAWAARAGADEAQLPILADGRLEALVPIGSGRLEVQRAGASGWSLVREFEVR